MKIAQAIIVGLLLASCSSESPERFSARISPDGKWIAENFLTDEGCCGGGFVSVKAVSDGSHFSKVADLGAPAPELFLTWSDGSHLIISQPESNRDLPPPSQHESIHVQYAAYKIPKNDAKTYNVGERKIAESVSSDQVTSDFSVENTERGAKCVLEITAHPHTKIDEARLKITGARSCTALSKCGGLWSSFSAVRNVGYRTDSTLTSATVSDIPSYNRLPEGETGSSLRGQFLGPNARSLLDQLDNPSMRFQYAFDFFKEVLEIEVPTKSIRTNILSFQLCLSSGNG